MAGTLFIIMVNLIIFSNLLGEILRYIIIIVIRSNYPHIPNVDFKTKVYICCFVKLENVCFQKYCVTLFLENITLVFMQSDTAWESHGVSLVELLRFLHAHPGSCDSNENLSEIDFFYYWAIDSWYFLSEG